MKIGVLTHIKHPIAEPFAGGLEAFAHEITSRLAKRGHAVTLFAREGSSPDLPLVPMRAARPFRSGTRRHDHDRLSAEFVAEHHAYMDCMQSIDRHAFDIVLNNSLHYLPITMAALITTPMLTVLHTPPFFELINAISAQYGRGGGHYCTVSHTNARNWAEHVPQCPVISNGISLDHWKPSGKPLVPYAIWGGRLVPEKGAHIALDAARLAKLPIRIAGHIEDRHYFETQIRPRLSGNATYLGHLAQSPLSVHIAGACVTLVTPCWEEPFGLVVAESLACGTPVAALDRGAIRELASHDTVAFAPTNDAAGLAQAIASASVLSRTACRQRALDLWDIDAMVVRYEEMLAGIRELGKTGRYVDA